MSFRMRTVRRLLRVDGLLPAPAGPRMISKDRCDPAAAPLEDGWVEIRVSLPGCTSAGEIEAEIVDGRRPSVGAPATAPNMERYLRTEGPVVLGVQIVWEAACTAAMHFAFGKSHNSET